MEDCEGKMLMGFWKCMDVLFICILNCRTTNVLKKQCKLKFVGYFAEIKIEILNI